MNLIIIGRKKLFEKIKYLLKSFYDNPEIYFFDSSTYALKSGRSNFSETKRILLKKPSAKIILASENSEAKLITPLLKKIHSKEVFFIPNHFYPIISSISNINDILFDVDVSKPRLDYVEFHITDHCNLKCKGCGHFSNIEEEKIFANYESLVNDLKRLKKLFWGIEKIRLMGGEPLLNPELPKFVAVSREIFPDSDIRVVTNGLLIPKINDSLVQSMKQTNTGFDISQYPATEKKVNTILSTLKQKQIEYIISPSIQEFSKAKTLEPVNDKSTSFWNCDSRHCHHLRDGMLATCPLPILSKKINSKYDLKFPTNEVYKIHEEIDAWKLYDELINKPLELCSYCTWPKNYEWEIGTKNSANLQDWVIPLDEIPMLKSKFKYSRKNIKTKLRDSLSEYPIIKEYVKKVYSTFRKKR